MNKNIFREYDIRGVYEKDFNEQDFYKIAVSFAVLYPKSKKIAVACDSRLSSLSLKEAIIKGLLASGKEVFDLGLAPDPLFYFSIFNRQLDAGIMISGSHNPKEYNGLMMTINENGKVRDLIGADIQKIAAIAMKGDIAFGDSQGSSVKLDLEEDYIEYVAKIVSLNRPLKIILDAGNGACGYLPEKIFQKLGCSVKTIFAEPDGNFPNHLPDPYDEKNLQALQKEVIGEKADLGFAFDTDGDRVAMVDNNGRVVNGDVSMLLLAQNALQKKKGPIIHDMRISKMFLDEMQKQGVETYFSVCHHNAVIDNIISRQAVFGGEITFHFFFPLDYYLADDAVFSALKLAQCAAEKDNLSLFVDSLPRYFNSPEIFIDCPDDEKAGKIENLSRILKEKKYQFIDVDGARINLANGWALARISNTSPMIKCRFEGDSKEDLIKVEKEILPLLAQAGIHFSRQNMSLFDI